MHLTKIPNSPNWYVQWQEAGRSIRRSTGTRVRREAEEFLKVFLLEQQVHPTFDPSVSEVLDWYVENHGRKVARPDTILLAVRYLKEFFGEMPVSTVRLGLQQAYLDQRRSAGAGHESIRRDLSVLAAALRRAEKYDLIDRAPPALTLPAGPARERWLTRIEAATLYRQLRSYRQKHVLLFTRLAIATGARSTAILELTWDRVDLDRGVIDYNVAGRQQTNKRRAVVPIEPHIVRALRQAKRHSRCDHVISWAGKPIIRIYAAFVRQAQNAGLPGVTPHTLRHTAATWAAQRGVSLFLVGGLLGQTVVSTTARYAKYNPDALRQVSSAIRHGRRR